MGLGRAQERAEASHGDAQRMNRLDVEPEPDAGIGGEQIDVLLHEVAPDASLVAFRRERGRVLQAERARDLRPAVGPSRPEAAHRALDVAKRTLISRDELDLDLAEHARDAL